MNDTAQAPLQGATFTDCTITLAGVDATYPGKKLGETGLGYWIAEQEDEDDDEPVFYAPTHIPTGHRLTPAGPFFSEEHCQHYIRDLAALMNWNRPMEELIADPAYSPKQFIEIYRKHVFEDATATAGGGQW